MKIKAFFRLSNWLKISGILAGVILLAVIGFGIMLQKMPSIGAYGADYLRKIIGQEAVAELETSVFNIQDSIKKVSYSLNLDKPSDPWQITAMPVLQTTNTPGSPVQQTPTPVVTKAAGDQPAAATSLPNWMPAKATPLGNLDGVGEWQPYISNAAGKTIAYRTFLQPDPDREYAVVAVVAFNLKEVHLHYQVGFEDPYKFGIAKFTDGTIPPKYLKPNVLLAVFNGGFKYEHGTFGSMMDGNVSVPPTNGMGTLAIFKDGHYQMGEWGKDLNLSADIESYRQNGPLVIQNGVVNPKVSDSSYWGYTVSGATVAWRSGIALDKDKQTLYYLIGPYLTIDMLAKTMNAINAWDAMQLDINNYWTIFEAFPPNQGKLVPQPLLPKDMNDNLNRFMNPYARDFFYITDGNQSE